MKKIDEFVDAFYINVKGEKKEILELKEEMKNHLYEAVTELKNSGKNEEESIKTAIERFGGEEEIRSVLGGLFRVQKLFAKRVLFTALTFLIIPGLFYLYYFNIEKDYYMETENTYRSLLNILGSEDTITTDMKNRLETVLEKKDFIYQVEFLKSAELFSDEFDVDPDPIYKYERNLDFFHQFIRNRNLGEGGFGGGNDTWYMRMDIKSYDEMFSNYIIPRAIIIYWVLFAIWGIINVYHKKRLNVGWILAISLLNFIGFFIFILFDKIKSRTENI
ncbi:permease prefix domain 1-containing protein [Niallia sp. JL1B1071]|uniref:permease prefix domain 1-containing protein n=1 Tax=Niallia tiangongensis TaxID=3237105 RepID=UPI0037DCB399